PGSVAAPLARRATVTAPRSSGRVPYRLDSRSRTRSPPTDRCTTRRRVRWVKPATERPRSAGGVRAVAQPPTQWRDAPAGAASVAAVPRRPSEAAPARSDLRAKGRPRTGCLLSSVSGSARPWSTDGALAGAAVGRVHAALALLAAPGWPRRGRTRVPDEVSGVLHRPDLSMDAAIPSRRTSRPTSKVVFAS